MKLVWSAVVVVMTSSVVGAQSGKAMERQPMGPMAMTYTGCVESINHGASFMLTHVAEDGMDAMHHDMSMKSGDATMKKEMAPTALKLTGSGNLKKQVGKKVTVTGTVAKDSMSTMDSDPQTLTVRSLKVIAKSCS